MTDPRMKNQSIRVKKDFLFQVVPEQEDVTCEMIRKFFTKDLGYSHKSITIMKKDKFINKEWLAKMYTKISAELKNGYIFCSLDETGFGNSSLQRYGWAKKGKPATGKYRRIMNITLLAVIHPAGLVQARFVKGGVDSSVYYDFVKELFERFEGRKKLLLMVENLGAHKTSIVKKLATKHSHITIFNLPYTCRANPIEYFFTMLKSRLRNLNLNN